MVAILALASCEKQGIDRFRGNYSFKTSGSITVVRDPEFIYDTTYVLRDGAIDTVVTEHSDPMTLSLTNEMGQMDITVVDAKENGMVVTMNVTGGDMVVYYASAEGKDLVLDEAHRHISLFTPVADGQDEEFGLRPVVSDVTVTGGGQKYDNIILLDLRYEGDFWANDRLYHITDCDIVCRAKLNE